MHGEEDHLAAGPRGAERHDRRAQQRSALEVEGAHRLLAGEPPDLRVAPAGGTVRSGRQRGEVDDREPPRRRRRHHLDRRAVDDGEGGAQRRVAADDLVDGGGERRQVEAAAEADRGRDVVGRRAGVEPVEEPQPLLGEGERRHHLLSGRRRRDSDRSQARLAAAGLDLERGGRGQPREALFEIGGEAGDRRGVEEGRHRDRPPQPLLELEDQMGAVDRVAAEGEEAVLRADRAPAQHLGVGGGEQALERRPRHRPRASGRRRRRRQAYARSRRPGGRGPRGRPCRARSAAARRRSPIRRGSWAPAGSGAGAPRGPPARRGGRPRRPRDRPKPAPPAPRTPPARRRGRRPPPAAPPDRRRAPPRSRPARHGSRAP